MAGDYVGVDALLLRVHAQVQHLQQKKWRGIIADALVLLVWGHVWGLTAACLDAAGIRLYCCFTAALLL
jgi:hypothetical protein